MAPLGIHVDTKISLIALIISILSFGMSLYFWRLQFRPIVTAGVRTVKAGNVAITYALHVMNSGAIPAKNIQIKIDESSLDGVLGKDSSEENLARWVRSINKNRIHLLQNGDRVTCSFGTSRANDEGFWKYGAEIPIEVAYQGWFGYSYTENQVLKIQDSDSFTGYVWNANA